MTTVQIINAVGLLFDISGVVILFKYGLPADVSRNGAIYKVYEQEDESEKRRWERYNSRSRIGLGLIIIGFVFQILSQFLYN